MRDWKTPIEQVDASILEARAALARSDAAGIEEALCDVPDIVNDLLDEVIAAQLKSTD